MANVDSARNSWRIRTQFQSDLLFLVSSAILSAPRDVISPSCDASRKGQLCPLSVKKKIEVTSLAIGTSSKTGKLGFLPEHGDRRARKKLAIARYPFPINLELRASSKELRFVPRHCRRDRRPLSLF